MHTSNTQEIPRRNSWSSCVESINNLTPDDIKKIDNNKIEVKLNNVTLQGREVTILRELDLSPETELSVIKERMLEAMRNTFEVFGSRPDSSKPKRMLSGTSRTFQQEDNTQIITNASTSSSSEEESSCSSSSSSSSTQVIPKKKKSLSVSETIDDIQHLVKGANPFGRSKPKLSIDPEGIFLCDNGMYESDVEGMVKAWADFDQRLENLIQPLASMNMKLKRKKGPTSTPQYFEGNYNGMAIAIDNLKFKPTAKPITLLRGIDVIDLYEVEEIRGEKIQNEEGVVYYSPKDKQVYYPRFDAINHDQVIVSGGGKKPVFMTLCDGCNKGPEVALAALTAADGAHTFLQNKIKRCSNIQVFMRYLYYSLKHAQEKIAPLRTYKDTTIIQTAIVDNILFGASIGDSKAFIFRPKPKNGKDKQTWDCLPMIKGARDSTLLANPGGYLKCSSDYDFTPPDTVNMNGFIYPLQEGDVVVVCSDGITDNFDPMTLGIKPSELGIESQDNTWDTIDKKNQDNIAAIENWSASKMAEVITGATNGEEIREFISVHVIRTTTERISTYLINNNDPKLHTLSGKMDDGAFAYCEYITQ